MVLQAHIEAGLAVGAPFVREGPYDFGKSGVPKQTAKHGKTFLKDRLVAPPKEVYPLHRKLSGSYMTCIRIGVSSIVSFYYMFTFFSFYMYIYYVFNICISLRFGCVCVL